MNLKSSDLYKDLDRGDGVCMYFDSTAKLCTIYENLPLKCNIDQFYEHFFKNTISKEEYYQLNYNSCKQLKQKEKKCI